MSVPRPTREPDRLRPGRAARDSRVHGFSLLETMLGVVLLSFVLLALAGATVLAANHVHRGRLQMARWTAMQQQLETLVAGGHDDLTAGSSSVQGYPMSWTVEGSDPKKLVLVVSYDNNAGDAAADTMIAYLPEDL